DISDLVKWMCEKPACLVNLEYTKGKIEAGYQADFVIWNPEQTQVIDKNKILHKHKLTAYEKHLVSGVVEQTILRGEVVYDKNNANNFNKKPMGKAL
ncbi:MAG: amidohydrolase family protein, partial [Proteobacteria bacterium]|nr:amidohydrolase family protein [Pseudomonadota bacterium]